MIIRFFCYFLVSTLSTYCCAEKLGYLTSSNFNAVYMDSVTTIPNFLKQGDIISISIQPKSFLYSATFMFASGYTQCVDDNKLAHVFEIIKWPQFIHMENMTLRRVTEESLMTYTLGIGLCGGYINNQIANNWDVMGFGGAYTARYSVDKVIKSGSSSIDYYVTIASGRTDATATTVSNVMAGYPSAFAPLSIKLVTQVLNWCSVTSSSNLTFNHGHLSADKINNNTSMHNIIMQCQGGDGQFTFSWADGELIGNKYTINLQNGVDAVINLGGLNPGGVVSVANNTSANVQVISTLKRNSDPLKAGVFNESRVLVINFL